MLLKPELLNGLDPDHILDGLPVGGIEHFGRPLGEHLKGTCELLAQWGSPHSVRLAGLLHSVYGTHTFKHAAMELDARDRLRQMIGEEAESLVFLFAVSDRKRLLLENLRPPFTWIDHRSGERHPLAENTLRALAEIEAANFLEQMPVVDSMEILEDMQRRFDAAVHLLTAAAEGALRTAFAAARVTRCGYALARALLQRGEVEPLVGEAMTLWERYREGGASNLRVGIRVDDSGAPIMERLDPVSDVSNTFRSLNEHPVLLGIAQAVLGEAVTVMKEKLIYKWPGTLGFGLHRDCAYNTPRNGVPGSEAITVCLALAPADRANGALELFPSLRKAVLAPPPGEPRDIDESGIAGAPSVMPELEPGDAVIFDGQVPHRSGHNGSDRPRLTYMITYVPARYGRAREDYYAARRQEQRQHRSRLLNEALHFD